ncbi:MAG: hypothetical protein JWP49_2219 [Phenylobacterium sp.]|nr:hypothetical protein [Phenylobacterium sp.]
MTNLSPLPSVSATDLAGGAYRLVREHLPRLAPIWIVLAACTVATLIYRRATGLDHSEVHPIPAVLGGYLVSLPPVLVGAAVLRVLFNERAWWRLDRGLLEYVGLMWAGTIIPGLLAEAPAHFAASLPPAERLPYLLGEIVLLILFLWVVTRLQLWPIGRLLGAGTTAGASWRLMRGAVWPYLLGLFLVFLAPMIPGVFLFTAYRSTGGWGSGAAAGILLSFGALLAMGLNARIYERRARGQPA